MGAKTIPRKKTNYNDVQQLKYIQAELTPLRDMARKLGEKALADHIARAVNLTHSVIRRATEEWLNPKPVEPKPEMIVTTPGHLKSGKLRHRPHYAWLHKGKPHKMIEAENEQHRENALREANKPRGYKKLKEMGLETVEEMISYLESQNYGKGDREDES